MVAQVSGSPQDYPASGEFSGVFRPLRNYGPLT